MNTTTNFDAWMKGVVAEQSASPFGYHFFQLYNSNKWEWFTRWMLGIRPTLPKPSLVLGTSVHKAIECYYTFGMDAVPTFLTQYYDHMQKQYDQPFLEQRQYAQEMMAAYINTFPSEQDTYRTVHTELKVTATLPNGFPLTGRVDRIVEDRQTGTRFAVETKTTGWSITQMAKKVALEDQITTYLYLLAHADPPIPVDGMLLEVLYRNPRGGVAQVVRPAIITRTSTYLNQYAIMLSGIVDDLFNRLRGLWHESGKRGKLDLDLALYLFPRNGEATSQFGDEYSPIWAQGFSLNPPIPEGFLQDRTAPYVVEGFYTAYKYYVLKEELSDEDRLPDPYSDSGNGVDSME